MAARRKLLGRVKIILRQWVVSHEFDVTIRTEMTFAKVVQSVNDGDAEVLNAPNQELVRDKQPGYSSSFL